MAKYMTMDEYLNVLRAAIPDDFYAGSSVKQDGKWHPEDLASAVYFANEVTGKVLAVIE